MQGVTESMADRAAVLHLLPFSTRETPKVTLLRGGYPEVVARAAEPGKNIYALAQLIRFLFTGVKWAVTDACRSLTER